MYYNSTNQFKNQSSIALLLGTMCIFHNFGRSNTHTHTHTHIYTLFLTYSIICGCKRIDHETWIPPPPPTPTPLSRIIFVDFFPTLSLFINCLLLQPPFLLIRLLYIVLLKQGKICRKVQRFCLRVSSYYHWNTNLFIFILGWDRLGKSSSLKN